MDYERIWWKGEDPPPPYLVCSARTMTGCGIMDPPKQKAETEVNKHCGSKWNLWKASLRRDYFSSLVRSSRTMTGYGIRDSPPPPKPKQKGVAVVPESKPEMLPSNLEDKPQNFLVDFTMDYNCERIWWKGEDPPPPYLVRSARTMIGCGIMDPPKQKAETEVSKHCDSKWNLWKASLRCDYFSSLVRSSRTMTGYGIRDPSPPPKPKQKGVADAPPKPKQKGVAVVPDPKPEMLPSNLEDKPQNSLVDFTMNYNCELIWWKGEDPPPPYLVRSSRTMTGCGCGIRDPPKQKAETEANKHCGSKWNLWKASLRRDYFSSPWALISLLAGVFLLLLTAMQTVYSVCKT